MGGEPFAEKGYLFDENQGDDDDDDVIQHALTNVFLSIQNLKEYTANVLGFSLPSLVCSYDVFVEHWYHRQWSEVSYWGTDADDDVTKHDVKNIKFGYKTRNLYQKFLTNEYLKIWIFAHPMIHKERYVPAEYSVDKQKLCHSSDL